jgi:hypothetical protein
LDGRRGDTQGLNRLIKVALSDLRRSLASRFAGNLIRDFGNDFLVQNYFLRVLSALDPHQVLTRAALDFGRLDCSPKKFEF